MKKLLPAIFAFACLLTGKVNAQVFFSDDFSNQNLPNWTVTNLASGSTVLWKWSNNASSAGSSAGTFNYAGAANGHLILDSDNDGDQTGNTTPEYTVITSQAINCTGKPAVILNFAEYYARYHDTVGVYVSNDSTNWTLVHNSGSLLNVNAATANPNLVQANVSSVAANQAKFYIRFSWKGDWDYWWFVDDVTLRVPDASDAAVVSISNELSNGCLLTNNELIGITIKNAGLTPLTSVTAKYSVNGGTPVSESVTLSPLPYDSSHTYIFTTHANFSAPNNYQITAWVELAGDTAHANDTAFNLAISAMPLDVTPPYTMGFEVPNFGTEIGALTWTSEDANHDGSTWFLSTASPNTGSVHYRYLYNFDGTTAADDWLFTPCLNMSSTTAYRIQFYDQTGADANGAYPEKLELKAGTTKSSGQMNETVTDLGALVDTVYTLHKAAFKPAGTGIYYVGFHCYSDANMWYLNVDDVTIDTLPKPTAQFSLGMVGSIATVTDGSDDLITSWTWHWGDGQSSIGQDPGTHTYSSPGTYTVCLVVTNLAGSDSTCHTVTISGIKDADMTSQISVFPNPTNRILNVMMSDQIKGSAQIEIVNVIGETLLAKISTGNAVEKFDLDKLAQGVYFVRISSENGKAIKKFVYAR
jgi:PKD repeat protein